MTNPRPRVIAVIPTFRPPPDVVPRLTALLGPVDEVIAVDDGSPESADGVLTALESNGVTVIRRSRNEGIASALNVGTSRALDGGADFVLHCDQDTDLPIDYVDEALDVFRRGNPVTRIGIVCPDRINHAPSLPTWSSPEGLGLVPEAIQTGMLISRECWEWTGPLDERLIIDDVDTEFCLRARDAGFRIAIAAGTTIRHSIGRRVPVRIGGVRLRHPGGRVATYEYHEPYRRYYITRNNVDLILRNARRRPRWGLTVIKRSYSTTVMSVVSGPRGAAQALAIGAGLVDGLVRRRGRIPRWLERAVGR